MKTIKKGFYLEITTWENDYDHVKTEAHRYDTLEDLNNALFIVKTMCARKADSSIDYYDDIPMEVLEEMRKTCRYEHVDWILDEIGDLIGHQYESSCPRVVEKYTTYLVSQDVTFPEVTIV